VKFCKACNTNKIEDSFYKDKSKQDGLTFYCKLCYKLRQRAYSKERMTEEQRQKNNARSKLHRELNPERVRNLIKKAYYLKNYGITYEQFLAMYEASGKKCSICDKVVIHLGRNIHNRAVLDHCHKTGKIRNILCHMCNASIGLMREDKELIMKVYKYLERHDG
jgi:hypothetical protein